MDELIINGALLRDMFQKGAALLEKEKATIDALNVFPVPDGDTGTNMGMTMQSAIRELNACKGTTVSEVASAVSLGALKGARGNSGVILSQLFRGFAQALKGCDTLDAKALATALRLGTEAAYKAVMRPKEGTMLTVARMVCETVKRECEQGANLYTLIDKMVESGNIALELTPTLLPVLKEAGVVDSGGKGIMTIYRGFKMAVDGEDVDDYIPAAQAAPQVEDGLTLDDVNDITFGYCTEFFIIHLEESFDEERLEKFRSNLISIGDSVVVVHDTGFIKVHVHSNVPGKVLQMALRLGEVDKIKIENMREQNREIQEKLKREEKENAMVSVSVGAGISDVFKDLGAAAIIEGGQTMNPSIDTILKAIKRANARNVFVLPNNSNIILAAKQAAELSDRNVFVIPTKSIMQGISAAMAFNAEADAESISDEMNAAFAEIVSGAVTYAVRTTSFKGRSISEGDIIGIMDGEIAAVEATVDEAATALLNTMMEKKSEDALVTVFYGEDVQKEQAEKFLDGMQKLYPDAEFTLHGGGQPLYYYYFSVE